MQPPRRSEAVTPEPHAPANEAVAERLRRAATLLSQQGANPFRVSAYRRAADTIAALPRDVSEILTREGAEGLVRLPNVGRGIAGAIREMVRTGRWGFLERLQGTVEPEELFQAVPGLGPELARRIHEALDIDSLEGLELAAHDGRLESVRGIGPRRAEAIRASLDRMLGRRMLHRERRAPDGSPSVEILLDVDREYREKARTGELQRITPRRFNPRGEKWLPILHADRDGWHLTALYSNTKRAHDLGKTHDWVVIYAYDDDHAEVQHTVVTERRGELAGLRVVRGREEECRRFYERESSSARS